MRRFLGQKFLNLMKQKEEMVVSDILVEINKINYATLWYATKDKRLKYQIINNVKYIKVEDLDDYVKSKRKSPNT